LRKDAEMTEELLHGRRGDGEGIPAIVWVYEAVWSMSLAFSRGRGTNKNMDFF
jgi:hypothetical protein